MDKFEQRSIVRQLASMEPQVTLASHPQPAGDQHGEAADPSVRQLTWDYFSLVARHLFTGPEVEP